MGVPTILVRSGAELGQPALMGHPGTRLCLIEGSLVGYAYAKDKAGFFITLTAVLPPRPSCGTILRASCGQRNPPTGDFPAKEPRTGKTAS